MGFYRVCLDRFHGFFHALSAAGGHQHPVLPDAFSGQKLVHPFGVRLASIP
jgi:hypothetical protein